MASSQWYATSDGVQWELQGPNSLTPTYSVAWWSNGILDRLVISSLGGPIEAITYYPTGFCCIPTWPLAVRDSMPAVGVLKAEVLQRLAYCHCLQCGQFLLCPSQLCLQIYATTSVPGQPKGKVRFSWVWRMICGACSPLEEKSRLVLTPMILELKNVTNSLLRNVEKHFEAASSVKCSMCSAIIDNPPKKHNPSVNFLICKAPECAAAFKVYMGRWDKPLTKRAMLAYQQFLERFFVDAGNNNDKHLKLPCLRKPPPITAVTETFRFIEHLQEHTIDIYREISRLQDRCALSDRGCPNKPSMICKACHKLYYCGQRCRKRDLKHHQRYYCTPFELTWNPDKLVILKIDIGLNF